MEPYCESERAVVYHGDCLDVLRELDNNSVDAVVTDPPYGLEFMGKDWDRFGGDTRQRDDSTFTQGDRRHGLVRHGVGGSYGGDTGKAMRAFQAWCEQWAAECLRVLKPGGHMLAFGGTRTWHRLACAIEDAGFEIRDNLAWMYGSGFPKSLDVSKAIDKAAGAERGRTLRPAFGGTFSDDGGTTYGTVLDSAPATPDAARWQGWGTALKPAYEPIVLARKPLAGTVASNVLAWGAGALNVDGCRIPTSESDKAAINAKHAGMAVDEYERRAGSSLNLSTNPIPLKAAEAHALGRWPANVVLDEAAAAMLDEQSGERLGKGGTAAGWQDEYVGGKYAPIDKTAYVDAGGASRFFKVVEEDTWNHDPVSTSREPGGLASGSHSRLFYTAKAGSDERPRNGTTAHPTVKPLDLMRWLVRLVTPPGGTVLEPFAGSGTTVEACILEGFRCVAIEREADYLPLVLQRISRRVDPVSHHVSTRSDDDEPSLFDLLAEEGGAA